MPCAWPGVCSRNTAVPRTVFLYETPKIVQFLTPIVFEGYHNLQQSPMIF